MQQKRGGYFEQHPPLFLFDYFFTCFFTLFAAMKATRFSTRAIASPTMVAASPPDVSTRIVPTTLRIRFTRVIHQAGITFWGGVRRQQEISGEQRSDYARPGGTGTHKRGDREKNDRNQGEATLNKSYAAADILVR